MNRTVERIIADSSIDGRTIWQQRRRRLGNENDKLERKKRRALPAIESPREKRRAKKSTENRKDIDVSIKVSLGRRSASRSRHFPRKQRAERERERERERETRQRVERPLDRPAASDDRRRQRFSDAIAQKTMNATVLAREREIITEK